MREKSFFVPGNATRTSFSLNELALFRDPKPLSGKKKIRWEVSNARREVIQGQEVITLPAKAVAVPSSNDPGHRDTRSSSTILGDLISTYSHFCSRAALAPAYFSSTLSPCIAIRACKCSVDPLIPSGDVRRRCSMRDGSAP